MEGYVNPNVRLNSLRATSLTFGENAGYVNQGDFAIALGHLAGYTNQGRNAIALGTHAGSTNQAANSIVINASGANLEAQVPGFFVDPIRTLVAGNAAVLHYDFQTKEMYASNTLDNDILPETISVTTVIASGNLSALGVITGNISADDLVTGKVDNARLPDALVISGNVTSNAGIVVAEDATVFGTLSAGVLTGNISADDLVTGKVDNARLPDALVITGNVTSNATLVGAELVVLNDAKVQGSLRVSKNLVIAGNLHVLSGNVVTIETETQITDQISITNAGTGPALVVDQKGSEDIADFMDDGAVVLRIHDGGRVSVGGDVPVARATMHVIGNVFSEGNVTTQATLVGNSLAVVRASVDEHLTAESVSVHGTLSAGVLTGNISADDLVTGKVDNARLPDALIISGNVTSNATLVGARLAVGGNASVVGTLSAGVLTGTISADDLVTGKVDNARLPDAPISSGNVTSNATLVGAGLFVSEDAAVGRDAAISRDATVGGNVSVLGTLSAGVLTGTISADDLATGKVDNARLPDALVISGNVTSNATLVGAGLFVSDDATVGRDATVSRDATVGRDAAISRDATVGGNVSVLGTLSAGVLTGTISANDLVIGKVDNARLPDALVISGNVTSNATLVGAELVVLNDAKVAGSLRVSQNLVIAGNLLVLSGNVVTIETETQITDQISITNAGTGPALSVDQSGAEDIADFMDDGAVVLRIHDGGRVSVGGDVPVARATMHVIGNVFSEGNVYTDAFFVGNGSHVSHINASELAFGTVDNSRLPATVAIAGNVSSGAALVSNTLRVARDATVGGDLFVSGNVSAVGDVIAFFSDSRLKDNVTPISDPVERLTKIRGVFYTYNETAKAMGFLNAEQQVGVLAQDVQTALPHAVKPAPFDHDVVRNESRSGENYLTVQYERIVPLLIEAAKAQNEEIQSLKKLVSAMRVQIDIMRRRGRF